MRYFSAFVAVAAAFLIAFVFLQPVFSNVSNWGLYDWDQHMFYHESGRVSFLTFHQLPLWTPYYCGGNVLLANPQSPFLSPFFIFVLLFGTVVGLKLEALAFMAIGLLGAFFAARKLGCGKLPSIFAAVVFMFSSWFVSRVVVGHTTFFSFGLLPAVFLAYLGFSDFAASFSSKVRWAVFASVVLAVMFLSGGIYPFYAAMLVLVLFSLMDSASSRKLALVAAVIGVLVLAALLSSVKLLPVVDFTSDIANEKDVQLTSAGIVARSLFSRSQSIPGNDLNTGRDLVPEGRQKEVETLEGRLPWRWSDYSSYIGIIPALLALAAAILGFRRNWKLVIAAVFFFLLALGNSFHIWGALRQLPFFGSLHGPSRFIIVFVFFVALLSARLLSSLGSSKDRRVAYAAALICLVVVLDLFLVSRSVFFYKGESIAFSRAPLEIKATNLGSNEFIQLYSSAPYLSQYPDLLQGIGTLNCYERIHLRIRAVPQLVDENSFPQFIGNAYIAETNETLSFAKFTPGRVSLLLDGIPKAEAALRNGSELTMVINQNFYKGWKYDGATKDAGSYRGLLAAIVRKDDIGNELAFSYRPKAFVVGAFISVAAIALAALLLIRPSFVRSASRLFSRVDSHFFRQL